MNKKIRNAINIFLAAIMVFQFTPTALAAEPEDEIPALIITEICPDNAGADNYEYFEVYNTTDADINLTADDIGMSYIYSADSSIADNEVSLTYPEDTVVPAGTAVVFWLSYTSGSVDSTAKTEGDFKSHYEGVYSVGDDTDYSLIRVTGQNGMANSGNRGIRLLENGENLVWAYYPARTATADSPAHFKLASDASGGGMELLADLALPTPGYVDTDAVLSTQDNTAPQLLNFTASNESDSGVTISFTSNESGTCYYLVYSDETVPDADTVVSSGTSETAAAGENSVEISGLDAATSYKAYFAVKDVAGNISDVAEIEFTTKEEVSGDCQTLPPLLVTELLPDSTNVGASDGYEFIEIYNNSDQPIDFSDYKLDYLYPDTETDAIWPSDPDDVVIGSGKTLVFWIINGANSSLTADDFNTFFGTSLVEGTDLVKIYCSGMSNSSARGVSIVTNTKRTVSTGYYNLNGEDDTTANQGIQYVYNFNNPTEQTLNGVTPASPGVVSSSQKPDNPVQMPDDMVPPAITFAEENPTIKADNNFDISAEITDDNQVKTVTLYLKSNLNEDYTAYNLTASTDDTYVKTIERVDIGGKSSFTYYLTASDGTNKATSSVQTATVEGSSTESLRLSVEEGDILSGTVAVTAGGDVYPPEANLFINGTDMTDQCEKTLESDPIFVFEANGVNTFFQNGVVINDEVIYIFDDLITDWETLSTPVDMDRINQDGRITISIYAGTKAKTGIDENENNDDFLVKNIRLILSNGQTLRCTEYSNPDESISMGDSVGKKDYIDCTFTIPDEEHKAITYQWDTTATEDGTAEISATDTIGNSIQRTVKIDNTPPVITTDMEEKQYKGSFLITADASDEIAGVKSLTAELDGKEISLPYETSSAGLDSGDHVLIITALDLEGNQSKKTVNFTTPEENPYIPVLLNPAKDQALTGSRVTLNASVSDPTNDELTVKFREGYCFDGDDKEIEAYTGTTQYSYSEDRSDKKALSENELADIATTDGISVEQSSENEFPYYLFDIAVPDEAGDSFLVNVNWEGSSNSSAKVLMYVMNYTANTWEEVDRHIIGGSEAFTLSADIPNKSRVKDSKMTILIQHSEGYAGIDLPEDHDDSLTNSDDTPRGDYDFTLAWESDTQYYNAEYYQHQLDIHDYILKNRNRLNLQYLFHTGDIIDDVELENQWVNADAAYKLLDNAGLPYGVLAGNHDVSHKEEDYTGYWKYFGEGRYNQNPWYGGSYEDNKGHYDLLSMDGIDYIMLYMGWGIHDDEIDWMNQVLSEYPERKAILNFHEYILTTGGLGLIPQRIYDEVVSRNPNVCMVFCGHYHDAYTRIDKFDDDGDGVNDRKVYSILFDYQGLSEGGLGYLRLMHFSLDDEKIISRTYSPSLDDYDADDDSLDLDCQEFEISFSDLGIAAQEKVLSTDRISANIYTENEIAALKNVASGSEVAATWSGFSSGRHGWYVEASDNYGGLRRSQVRYLDLTNGGSHSNSGSSNHKTTPDPVNSVKTTKIGNQTISTLTATAKISTDGVSKADLTTVQVNDAVQAAETEAEKQGTGSVVKIEISGGNASMDTAVTFPQAALNTMAASSIDELIVQTPGVAISFDEAAIETIAKNSSADVTLKATRLEEEKLSDQAKAIVGSRPVYDFTVTSGDTTISDFGGGAAVVSIPYTLESGEDENKVVIYYLSDSGELVMVPHCVYDKNNGTVSFKTSHFSAYAVGYNDVAFTDVSGWSEKYINYLAARGIIKGTNGTSFSPQASITRAQLVTILANLSGDDLSGYKRSSFSDVKTTDWYFKAVEWAHDNGIAAGAGGQFNPNDNITRQDIAVMIVRYADKAANYALPENNKIVVFADNDRIASYAADAVTQMQQAGIISGRSDGSFTPLANASRAEAAKMIALLLEGMI